MHTSELAKIRSGKYYFGGTKMDVVVKECFRFAGKIYNTRWQEECKMLLLLQVLDKSRTLSLPLYHWEETDDCVTLVCQRASMDLFSFYEKLHIQRTPSEVVRSLSRHMHAVVKMLILLHGFGYAHLDIKPENIVCRDESGDEITFIDYADCIRADKTEKLHVNTLKPHSLDNCAVGTFLYSMPHVWRRQPYNLFAQDIWCVGMMTVLMATNCHIFSMQGDSATRWQHAFLNGKWRTFLVGYRPQLADVPEMSSALSFAQKLFDLALSESPNVCESLLEDEFLQLWQQ
jgi:serine/threonine protein kinase